MIDRAIGIRLAGFAMLASGLAGCVVVGDEPNRDHSKNRPAASSSEVSDAAEAACLRAVSRQTGQSDVAALYSEFSEANSMVMVGVGDLRAPWRCLVSNDGVVAEVSFNGNEG
jgi:hypothetical protein